MPSDVPTLADLGGLWRRTLYVGPDGSEDRESAVWWLQAGVLCGDIRARRPGAPAETAFAGRLETDGSIFGWRFEQSWGYPPDGPPDEGRLRWEGDTLREDGAHIPYLELWRRDPAPFRRAGRFPGGLLIEIGPFGFCARDGRFLLAERDPVGWRTVLSAEADSSPGAAVGWPEVKGGVIRFPEGALGPRNEQPFSETPFCSATPDSTPAQ